MTEVWRIDLELYISQGVQASIGIVDDFIVSRQYRQDFTLQNLVSLNTVLFQTKVPKLPL